jgi:hypothetical protein
VCVQAWQFFKWLGPTSLAQSSAHPITTGALCALCVCVCACAPVLDWVEDESEVDGNARRAGVLESGEAGRVQEGWRNRPHATKHPWYRRAERPARHTPADALLYAPVYQSAYLPIPPLSLSLLSSLFLSLPLPPSSAPPPPPPATHTPLPPTPLPASLCRAQAPQAPRPSCVPLTRVFSSPPRPYPHTERSGGTRERQRETEREAERERERRPRASRTPGSRALGVKKVVHPP